MVTMSSSNVNPDSPRDPGRYLVERLSLMACIPSADWGSHLGAMPEKSPGKISLARGLETNRRGGVSSAPSWIFNCVTELHAQSGCRVAWFTDVRVEVPDESGVVGRRSTHAVFETS